MHTCILRASALALAVSILPLLSMGAGAQLAVSANEGKVVNVDGKNVVVKDGQDSVTIIDLGQSPPR